MRHYVIYGSNNDYWKVSYKDIDKVSGATYVAGFLPEAPTVVRKFHTAMAVRKKLPLRKLWYSAYFSEKYHSSDDYVFVFFQAWQEIFQNGYLDYLRKKYPGCKCVLLLCDINQARKLNIEEQKKNFDQVLVFERIFAREKGIGYYPLVYSDFRSEICSEEKDIDLLFVGWAKGRYKLLKQIYDRLTAEGVNCQFYLTKLDEEVPEDSGIHTADWVPYDQNISLVKRAKCLLDIVPPNTDCNTLRVNEALSYKCKILTNNTRIISEEFYDPESISVYSAPEDIDIDFLLKPYNDPDYNGYITKMTPQALINYLDAAFFEKEKKV